MWSFRIFGEKRQMKCKDCNDTGQITLLTSIVPCKTCQGKNWFQMPIIKYKNGGFARVPYINFLDLKSTYQAMYGIDPISDIYGLQILPPGAQTKYLIDFVDECPEDNPSDEKRFLVSLGDAKHEM